MRRSRGEVARGGGGAVLQACGGAWMDIGAAARTRAELRLPRRGSVGLRAAAGPDVQQSSRSDADAQELRKRLEAARRAQPRRHRARTDGRKMSKRTLFNYYSSGSSSTPELENGENARQPKLPRVEFRCSDIISDPGLRKPIDEYPFEIRDQVKRAYALRGPTQPIGFIFPRKWQSVRRKKVDTKIRLTSSLDVVRFLIMQGDAFRGHDESSTSSNEGTFREMVDWYKDKVEIVKEAYDNGAKNCQMLSHHIQKDLTKACAEEVMAVIMDEICGRKFSILIDESRDVSIKEQMAVILRFVNDEGKVLERFLGLQHIERCTAIALKEALVSMISSHKLTISMLRGQGYDGASNMRGEFNGVQKYYRIRMLSMCIVLPISGN
ncbi:LOW QUALITY PROTEIN: hypothetical protein U9M48_032383 [Paspalum notatum var. saurae]|uniref:DUF4371 domain-containing protein n=1 Tax=Paspalum notatum var. saurae TaxID=547442 RepID=A0AAQ3U985_PASNO